LHSLLLQQVGHRPSCVATVALTTSLTNYWRTLLRGIDTYTADTEEALVASIASAAGVDASEVDIESVAFPVKVWIIGLFRYMCASSNLPCSL
jgi:hypothetical protein